MRIYVSVSLVLVLAAWGCGGDSSSLMTIGFVPDGGVPVATGGQGGQTSGGTGGALSQATVTVPGGGVRDVATTFCTTTPGDSCAVSAEKIACGKSYCGGKIAACYDSGGPSGSGKCTSYAACRLACSCDAKDRKKCEDKCYMDHVATNSDCIACITDLYFCSSQNNCMPPCP